MEGDQENNEDDEKDHKHVIVFEMKFEISEYDVLCVI